MAGLRKVAWTAARHPRRALMLAVALAASVAVALLMGSGAVALISRTVPNVKGHRAAKARHHSTRRHSTGRIVRTRLRGAALATRTRPRLKKVALPATT